MSILKRNRNSPFLLLLFFRAFEEKKSSRRRAQHFSDLAKHTFMTLRRVNSFICADIIW